MMKTAIAIEYGTITDKLVCNSDCDKLVFIFSNVPHLGGQVEPTEDQGRKMGETAHFTKRIYQRPEICR